MTVIMALLRKILFCFENICLKVKHADARDWKKYAG
jgi:hypothetical protein